MKKSILLAGIALFAVSCSDEINNQDTLVPVTVHVNGFSVAQEDFPETRTTTAADSYDGINAITLAFYKNGETETYKHEQLKSYATTYTTFGEFECSLPMGSYTMVVLAYHTSDGNPLVLTSPTAAAFTGHSFETFSKVETITINTTTAVCLSATLDRIIAQLKVVSTDGKTADVSNVRMTFSAGG